ncbi:MAG: M23 family metallopeptidase [Saprospiraceae bacterium]|nr:M23 family metallopeptidase [Saprospiraceae bacterium]
MPKGSEQAQNWWTRTKERLQNTYRLVIMNDETFEEVAYYRLTLLNVYIMLSTLIVLTAVLVTISIAYTPLKRYIPGYVGGGSNDRELYQLYREVQDLEKELAAQRTYSESFRKMLVQDVQTVDEVPPAKDFLKDSSMVEVGKTEEDQQLREEVEITEIGAIAKSTRTANLSPRDVPLEQMYFSPPVTGEISAVFMPDKKHYGVDILAPKNTAIKAAMDGYVFFSDWTQETGYTIGIQHSNNTITFYKHNSVLLKFVGSFVRSGEAVAIIGNTGTLSSGPHLHFELWNKGIPVDPTEYITF